MGWSYGPKPDNVKEELMESCTWEHKGVTNKALDCAIVNMRTAYLAVETVKDGSRTVWAAVILLQFSKGKYGTPEMGKKEMSEDMGPNEAGCPRRILELLTPLPDPATGVEDQWLYARQWRERCWAKINKRAKWPKLSLGLRLVPIDGQPRKMWSSDLDREVLIAELEVTDKFGHTAGEGRPSRVRTPSPNGCYFLYYRFSSFDLDEWRAG